MTKNPLILIARKTAGLAVVLASFAPKDVVLKHLKSFFPGRDLSKTNIFGIDEVENL